MLASRAAARPLRNRRLFAEVAPAATKATTTTSSPLVNAKFDVVKFKKEAVSDVMAEVPEMQYYVIGGQADPNPYSLVTMEERLLDPPSGITEPKSAMKVSMLENGLKIATCDRGGLVSQLGLFVNAGSRHEEPHEQGASNMVEMMAYKSTAHLSYLRTIKSLEHVGAQGGCQVAREHIMYNMEVNGCHEEIATRKAKLADNADEMVTELLHQTAYHRNSLGNKLLMSESSYANFTPETIREFMLKHYSPSRSVFVGVNVDHDELCKWLMRSYVDYNPIPHQDRAEHKAQYTGGAALIEKNLPLTNVAIGFETGGWNSEDLVPVTVLQMLLGGGGAFSTGGPGKGMHSRLFTNVMGRYPQVENCMAFNSMHSDSGLFGIYLAGAAEHVPILIEIAVNEFKQLNKFSEEEVSRAKNQLKASVYMNVENSKVLMEDIGRQLCMSGKVQSAPQFAAQIDKVTSADLVRVAQKFLGKTPTYLVYGDTTYAPNWDQVKSVLARK